MGYLNPVSTLSTEPLHSAVVMGRALRWICRIFCKDSKPNKRIKSSTKFRKQNRENEICEMMIAKRNAPGDESAARSSHEGYAIFDYSHAEAVVAASATAAEAAFVAAQAAVEVVRLTRSGRLEFDLTNRAAVVVQSHFRGHLARKALRALRSLVKLQALVRGYIVRKQTVDHMRRMHALLKAQAYARAIRAPAPASSYSSSHTIPSSMLDTSTSESSEVTTLARIKKSHPGNSSPWFQTGNSRSSSTRRRGEDYPEGNLSSAYPDIPNYMAYTKSSEAKSRSLSAPKQRIQLDRSSSTNSNSNRDLGRRPSPSRTR